MIIGGVDGACYESSCRSDYFEYYFPLLVTVGSDSVDAAFQDRTPVKYSATARIRNVADSDWVDLSDVTSFQVSGNRNGGGSANLTIRKPDKWNIDGTQYPDLLRPSSRALQLFVIITIKGQSYAVPAFSGVIENYSESHGQSGGAINITARANSIAMENRPTSNLENKTAYTRVVDELESSGLYANNQVPVVFFDDYILSEQLNFNNLLALIEGLAPVAVDVSTTQAGTLLIQPTGAATEEAQSFSLTDENQISVTRSVGSAQSYNYLTVIGLVDSALDTQIVKDDTDIARRGIIAYPYRYGNTARLLSENVSDAEALLAEWLRGKLSAQIQLNPFIGVGTVLGFESSRLFVTDGRARVGSYTHSFSVGNASTQIYDMAVL